jgi:hypothetical protein
MAQALQFDFFFSLHQPQSFSTLLIYLGFSYMGFPFLDFGPHYIAYDKSTMIWKIINVHGNNGERDKV